MKMKQRLSVQTNIYYSLSRSYNNENKIDKEININIAFATNAKFSEKIMYLI